MSAEDTQALAKAAKRLIAPCLEKIHQVATGRKYTKLRQNTKDLLDALPKLLEAPPKPAKPAGRAVHQAIPSVKQQQQSTEVSTSAPSAQQQQQNIPNEERVAVQITADGVRLKVVVLDAPAANGEGLQPAVQFGSRPSTASSLPTGLTIATPAEVPAADSAEDPAHFHTDTSASAGEFQVLPTPLGINPEAAQAVLAVLRESVETRRPPIIELALDCIQKLLAHRLVSGPVFHINHRRETAVAGATSPAPKGRKGEDGEGEEAGATEPGLMPAQAQAVELLCLCDDIPDEVVERRVLKGLLTAITSTSVFVHGQALLLAVRACYNIFLMSRDETNRVTAKATLTQMVNAVFQRMEAGDFVLVKPIVVTDVLGLPAPEAGTVSASVQAFLQEVVATVDLTGLYVAEFVEGIQRELDAAFSSQVADASTPKAGMKPSNSQLQLSPLPSSAPSAAAPKPQPALDTAEAIPSAAPPEVHQPEPEGASETLSTPEASSSGTAVEGNSTANAEGDPVTPIGVVDTALPVSEGVAASEGSQVSALPANILVVNHAASASAAGSAPSSPGPVAASPLPAVTSHVASPTAAAAARACGLSTPLMQRSAAMMARTQALLQKDAFLVFRALCKLSIKTADAASTNDQTIIRGKELALELLKILLENSGEVFRTTDRFISAIKQYLCLSLLKNCTSTVPQVQRLSCSIFLTLLVKFRQSLKAEVGLFYPMILLRPIEPVVAPSSATAPGPGGAADVAQRQVVLKCLETCAGDGQLLVDLFVNYDCDLEGANLLERTVQALVRLAQGSHVEQGVALPPEERATRVHAMRCLVTVLDALVTWYTRTSPDAAGYGYDAASAATGAPTAAAEREPVSVSAKGTGDEQAELSAEEQALARAQLAELLKKSVPQGDQAAADAAQAQLLESFKEYKRSFQAAIQLFNTKPKKGLALLQEQGFVGTQPEEVARFLTKTQGLDKAMIGEYMGEKDDYAINIMHAFTDSMDFTNHEFDEALRKYLDGFRLPGEAQKIDRFMLKFAERFVSCNPTVFASANVAYVLSYAVIMLNTDAHNPMVKKKMTKQDFLRNIRGINEGSDLNEVYMSELYDRIVNHEIVMKDDAMSAAGQAQAAEKQSAKEQQQQGLFSTIMSLIPGRKQQAASEPSDDAIKRTHDYLREQAKGATFFTTNDSEAARPILDVAWAPMLGAFSVNFEQFDDEDIVDLCLAGFKAGIRLECLLGMTMLRNTYLSSLARFTHLYSPGSMRMKNARAFRTLLQVAEENGNYLQECWEEVLRCISRFELLQQLAAGLPTDALLFGADKGATKQRTEVGFSERLTGALSLGSKSLFRRGASTGTAAPAGDAAALEQGFFLYLGKGGKGAKGGEAAELQVPPPDVLEAIDRSRLDRLYVLSEKLDSDAIVEFVRTLTKIAAEELRSVAHPRVFSLTKIVEISHFNMGRVRLVWSRIWSVLSDFFIEVGCHKNLQVAMYAVDSLRQLSMKFLERDELANFTFQNDFLRPFVFVMRQSKSVEIRELIIRCVSQMILARVSNVKSGWKSMFMVFTTAATDEQPQVVRLAFETIEKIVREYFSHITETETTTFTDCVNCLIAFTNNPHSLDVSLNAIAFLRYCAIQLAEGEIAMAELEAGETVAYNNNLFRVRDLMDDDTQAWSSSMSSTWDGKFHDQATSDALARKAQAEADQQALGERRASGASSSTAGATAPAGAAMAATPISAGNKLRMRFTDKDEHMYFWFPLLAGLSELTFDPRQEIRQSALEVLFDTLEFHGHSFTPQFWARVFDSVLLPIFDHVRAEVTDTTTFTDERRRADVDAWLYETCTQCLQHIVDLVVKFYPVVQDLLPRILDLLQGFVRRPHHSLAAVGVAGLVRLIINAGISFNEATWSEVLMGVGGMAADTLPAIGELVSRVERRDFDAAASRAASEVDPLDIRSPSDIRSPASNSPRSNVHGASAPVSPAGRGQHFSLSEGSGARRLAEVRCRASVQLLVVQACGEIYAAHSTRLRPRAVSIILDILQGISGHARDINSDMRMRHVLAWVQATDKVQEDKQLPDPPLLRLESEGSYAYLSMLLHIRSTQQSDFQKACRLDARLVQLCAANLSRYEGTSSASAASAGAVQQQQQHGASSPSLNPDENVALSPLVTATLKAVAGFPRDAFQRHLPVFFPLLTRLISCDHAPPEVQRSLSELFAQCIGPMLAAGALPPAASANGI